MYERILVPVDGSPTARAGLDEAIRLARLTGGRLRLLHVVDQLPWALAADGYDRTGAQVVDLLVAAGRELLDAARRHAASGGVEADDVLFETLDRALHERVLEQAKAWHADLVVLGTHGRRGVRRMLLGSDAELILRTSPVPVLLVRDAAPPPP